MLQDQGWRKHSLRLDCSNIRGLAAADTFMVVCIEQQHLHRLGNSHRSVITPLPGACGDAGCRAGQRCSTCTVARQYELATSANCSDLFDANDLGSKVLRERLQSPSEELQQLLGRKGLRGLHGGE